MKGIRNDCKFGPISLSSSTLSMENKSRFWWPDVLPDANQPRNREGSWKLDSSSAICPYIIDILPCMHVHCFGGIFNRCDWLLQEVFLDLDPHILELLSKKW